jgi:hypothetical protein
MQIAIGSITNLDLYTSPCKCSSDATLTNKSTECESPLRTSVCRPTLARASHSFSNCAIAFALSALQLALNSHISPIAQLTRLRKAIANHIIDIQIALERLGFRHNSRWARIVEQRVFEVVDFRGQASKARDTRWTLRELPRRMLGFGHSKKLRWCLESGKLTSVLCPATREMGLAWLLVVTSLLCIAATLQISQGANMILGIRISGWLLFWNVDGSANCS